MFTIAHAPTTFSVHAARASPSPASTTRRQASLGVSRSRTSSIVPRASSAGDAGGADGPIVGGKAAQDAARKALAGALGGKRDVLSQFDGGGKGGGPLDWFFGGGGGGDDGDESSQLARKISFWVFLVIAVLMLFKPVTAIAVNGVYYAFGWRTGREAPTEEELARASAPADADVISKYAADDDEDEDEDDDDEDAD